MANSLRRLFHATLVIVVIVTAHSRAQAQPIGQHFESVEWLVDSSDLILRGTIRDLATDKEETSSWQTVEFQVAETLKGEKLTTVRFVLNAGGLNQLKDWQADNRSIIVFLNSGLRVATEHAGENGLRGRHYLKFPYAPRTGYAKGSFLDLSVKPKPALYSLNLTRLDSTDEIRRALDAAISVTSKTARPDSCTVRLPGSGMLDSLTAPIDSRLEAAAQKWAKSKDMDTRTQGVTALMYFQSTANVNLLKSLLEDPEFAVEVKRVDGRVVEEIRHFVVRETAFQILTAWDIKVSTPTIKQTIP